MNTDLFAGIDLGTSGIKVVIADADDQICASASRNITTLRIQDGWNEQHPDDWWAAVCECFDELSLQKDLMTRVAGIGLSGHMLGTVLIDKNDAPLRHVLLWNDCRATKECAELLELLPDIGMRTSCTPDPGMGAPKLRWLNKHEPHIVAQADCLLLPKDYIRLKLTGQRFSEPSDAGGTMLMDCASSTWCKELCDAADWDLNRLPELIWSWDNAGELTTELCKRFNIPAHTPVAAGAGDNMACSLGVGVAVPGDCAVSIGTSGVMCTATEQFTPLPDTAFLTGHHAAPDCYLSMGVVMSATASFEWLAGLTGHDTETLSGQIDALYNSGQAFHAPVAAPCLNGIRTPHNVPAARGLFQGINLSTSAAMLGWSVFEGVAFQFKECQLAQQNAGINSSSVLLVGGGANSELWCRIIATVLDQPVTLPLGRHLAACLGATRLAQVAAGAGTVNDVLERKPSADSVIEPEPAMKQALDDRFGRYQRLLTMETATSNHHD